MYNKHQTAISRWARKSPDNFAQVLLFVILTIRNPLHRVPDDMKEVIKRGPKAVALWGWKEAAYRYIEKKKANLFQACEDIYHRTNDPEILADLLLLELVQVPGLGLVKAGFCAQLIYGVSGCIDTHNLERFGIPPRTFRHDTYAKGTVAKRQRWVRYYNETVERLGGTQRLWDGWCEYVASQQPAIYQSADHVSRLHCDALGVAAS